MSLGTAFRSSWTSQRLLSAEARLCEAKERLQQAIHKESDASVRPLAELLYNTSNHAGSAAAELELTLARVCESIEAKYRTKSRTNTIKDLIRKWFRASYPFVQMFLTISKEGANVNHR